MTHTQKITKIRDDFPLLATMVNGYPIAYLDNGSTVQKPWSVINAITHFYTTNNANTFRGVYQLAEKATIQYEQARQHVARFIGAAQSNEIVFTRGTTHGINLVAHAWALHMLKSGDEILLTQMEHHSNLLPWRAIAQMTGAIVRYVPLREDQTLDVAAGLAMINPKTKLVALCHTSNVLGETIDIEQFAKAVHAAGGAILVDAAQSIAHIPIDVVRMGIDFLVFSGHKMMGPMGIGVLYVNATYHEQMGTYEQGGGMVYAVDNEQATFTAMPQRLEAGTPSVADAVGLAAAIDYLKNEITYAWLEEHIAMVSSHLLQELQTIARLHILGSLDKPRQTISFIIDGIHAHDVASYLDTFGICVRAGHHCAQPLAQSLGVVSSVRVSLYAYNTIEEIDRLVNALKKLVLQ